MISAKGDLDLAIDLATNSTHDNETKYV